MIFDHKPLSQITDDEIAALVSEHVAEQQHLDYKLTVNNKDESDKLELLKDVVSLANCGGGYLFVGIRDDGKGKAQCFEPDEVGNTDNIKKSIRDLCIEHIAERIEDIDVETRIIKNNPIVIVRVPESNRTPHMVTFQNNTYFYTRYSDGKREMTIGEIREAFKDDSVDRRLSNIETILNKSIKEKAQNEFYNNIELYLDSDLLNFEEGEKVNKISEERFIKEIQNKSYFYISITPEKAKEGLIETSSTDIISKINIHPGSRKDGWNMDFSYFSIKEVQEGIETGQKDFKYLKLLDNGHMEFWVPLDINFCWKQPLKEFNKSPRLYPYTVIEYPVTFLRLYREIISIANIQENFILNMIYKNLKGYYLPPHSPGSVGFTFNMEKKFYDKNDFKLKRRNIQNNFKADKTGYDYIKKFYKSFDLGANTIPFYDNHKEEFEFHQNI